ncbi:hypothetical protein [Mycobacterium sp.]|uniref:hypothetical protein n=1 Tax=Mycobacterium sp. TaxID=1785 RepID=UPI003C770087
MCEHTGAAAHRLLAVERLITLLNDVVGTIGQRDSAEDPRRGSPRDKTVKAGCIASMRPK